MVFPSLTLEHQKELILHATKEEYIGFHWAVKVLTTITLKMSDAVLISAAGIVKRKVQILGPHGS